MPKTKAPKTGHTENQTVQQVHDAAALFGLRLERRNVMVARNPSGRPVACGEPGECDFTATIPGGPNKGRRLSLELKHKGFDPRKLSGSKADHFARQLAHMERVNREGGLALWIDSGEAFVRFMRRVMEWPTIRVEFEDGFPIMTDDKEGTPE